MARYIRRCRRRLGGFFNEKRRRVWSGGYSADPDIIEGVMGLTETYMPGARPAFTTVNPARRTRRSVIG